MNVIGNSPEYVDFEVVKKNSMEMNHIVQRIKEKLDWVANARRKTTVNADGSLCPDGRRDDSGENSGGPEAI